MFHTNGHYYPYADTNPIQYTSYTDSDQYGNSNKYRDPNRNSNSNSNSNPNTNHNSFKHTAMCM